MQFNLGFIIARLGDDLFIIDQHASDEKYRYEVLERDTKIHKQNLVCPLAVDLTAAEEMTVRENMSVFEDNGFSFCSMSNAHGRDVLRLTGLPMSKSTQFGVKDVRELASLLRDTGGSQTR